MRKALVKPEMKRVSQSLSLIIDSYLKTKERSKLKSKNRFLVSK